MWGAAVIARWKRRREVEAQRDEPVVVVAASSDGPSVEEVYHDAALAFLDQQVRINEVLDGRALQVFTIGSTVLPLTFALLNLTGDEAPPVAGWLLGAALVFYTVLIGCAAGAIRQRLMEYRPEIATLAVLAEEYRSLPLGGVVLQQWVAREYQESIEANRPLLTSKGRWIGWLNAMLFVECLCLSAAAGVTLFF